MKRIIFLFFICFNSFIIAQKKYQSATIAFYNVENLYDTIRSCDKINGFLPINDLNYHINLPEDSCLVNTDKIINNNITFENLKNKISYRKHILSDDFTFEGPKLWTKKRFNEKIDRLAEVFSKLGTDITQNPPVIIGLAEVENRQVIEVLTNNSRLKPYDYGISHFNSFDVRGIDVALIYQKKRFKVENEQRLIVDVYSDEGFREYTRDILLVSGRLDGEKIHFFVNHWPSRRGGEAKSEPRRVHASKIMKNAMDKIRKEEPNAKIICMGDFNDDPINKSIKKILNTVNDKEKISESSYYNPMEKMYSKGIGTLSYNDAMNLFDQMIVSPALIPQKSNPMEYFFMKAEVYSPSYLVAQEGQFKGYPFRSFGGDNYTGGYSDHYPVFSILLREIPEKRD